VAFKPLYDQLTHGPFLGSGDHYSPARADLAGLLEAVRHTIVLLGDVLVWKSVCEPLYNYDWVRGDRSASRVCFASWLPADLWRCLDG
jgi:hypothetical protein